MRAETRVAASAALVRGPLHRFASARPEILVVSSTGFAADDETLSALRSCAIELDLCARAGSRSLATSIRHRIDTAIQAQIPLGTAHGHCAIAAATTVTSPLRHPSNGPDQLRPVDPARRATRLTDRQLTTAA